MDCQQKNCYKKPFKPVTHVIFDLDGTILDTEKVYQKVISNIATSKGTVYNEEVHKKILGTNELDTSTIFIRELGLEKKLTPEQFLEEFRLQCKTALKNVALLPGAERLIRHLHKHKIPIAIATSSSQESVKIKTAHLMDLFNLFHHKVMSSSDPEVKHGKPAPDIYLICASRFVPPVKPENCLVFEDAPNGVTGALAAGMQVVAIPEEPVSKDLFSKDTTLFLKSMEQFVPENFGLPAF